MWFLYLPCIFVCGYAIYTRYFHPLASIPGPLIGSLTPLWLSWQGYRQRRPRLDLDLHKQYGSVVRISPNEVIFSNPEHFKAVYGAGTAYTKGKFYEAPRDNDQPDDWDKLDMLPEMDVDKLRVQKRFAGPIYSVSNVKRHEDKIDNNIRRFCTRMNTLTDVPLDIYHEIELLNVDVISEVTFAHAYGAVEAGSDGNHMATMDKIWKFWGWIGYLPWLNTLDKTYAPWRVIFSKDAPQLPVFPFAIHKIMGHQKAVDEGRPLEPCILDDLRRLTKTQPGFLYNWGTRLAMTDLGAGVDTMSWTLAAVLVGVGMNPQAKTKVKAELDATVREGRIKKGEPVSYNEAAKLTYFQACMQEALRIWPNIAISLPRIVPRGGVKIDGHYIPEGYTIGMNSKQLGFNETVFGPEPQRFRPERWMEADRARRNDMETRNLSFGGPSRKCPGMHLAWVCMSKILASFYLNYDLDVLNTLDGPPGPGGHVWVEKGSFPTKWHGLEVEITCR